MNDGMSSRGHKLIEAYYQAAWEVATAKQDKTIYATMRKLQKAFKALEDYIIYLESGGA